MSVLTDAILALSAVVHDPDIDLDPEDVSIIDTTIGLLVEYRED